MYSGCGWEIHGGDDLSCTLDYSRAASKQGCRYNRYIARTPAYVVYCRLQVAMMSLQVGLGVSDREASDTTPPRCLVCPVPEDQHASKDKTCSKSRAVHPTITFSPFSLHTLVIESALIHSFVWCLVQIRSSWTAQDGRFIDYRETYQFRERVRVSNTGHGSTKTALRITDGLCVVSAALSRSKES